MSPEMKWKCRTISLSEIYIFPNNYLFLLFLGQRYGLLDKIREWFIG